MTKITTALDLKQAIEQLELKNDNDWLLLKDQFLATYESLKPLNVIKNSFREFYSSPDLKNSIIDTTMSLAAGFLFNSLTAGVSSSPIRKVFGSLLQVGISNIVSKNLPSKLLPEKIKTLFVKKSI